MSDLFPLRHRPPANPNVRLRCNACEVAWSGPASSRCWVCDDPGVTASPLAGRDQATTAFDLELIV